MCAGNSITIFFCPCGASAYKSNSLYLNYERVFLDVFKIKVWKSKSKMLLVRVGEAIAIYGPIILRLTTKTTSSSRQKKVFEKCFNEFNETQFESAGSMVVVVPEGNSFLATETMLTTTYI